MNDKLLEMQTECCNNTESVLIKQGHELSLLKNKSTAIDQDMSSLKQLSSIKPLQQIQVLEEKVQSLSSQTTTLSLKERARSQDFLALYNMTTHSFSDLEMRTDSKFQQLSNKHNISFSTLNNRIYLLNNDTLHNQSKALDEVASGMQETEIRTNLTLTHLQKQIDDSTNIVVMTAQLGYASTKPGIVKFDIVEFSVGINDLSAYKSTGKFTCETGGIYIISASIMSEKNGAHYYIYLNGNQISDTYIGYSSSPPSKMYHTGTVVLARQLHPNDSLWVYSSSNFYMFNGLRSTLTIVKVK